MSAIIDWLTTQLTHNPALVALVVGLLAAGESLIVVGSFVPGTTILLALAAAAGAVGEGVLVMLAAATVGAILGDGVSYWVGRRYGPAIERWGPLARRPHVLSSAREMFARRGAFSIFVARFVPGLRTVVPAVAGMLRVSPAAFATANVASGIVWALVHILGAAFAAGLVARMGGRLAAILVGVLLLLGVAIWLARMAARACLPVLQDARVKIYRWSSQRSGAHSRILTRALDPEDATGLLILFWSAIFLGALAAFAAIAEDVSEGEPIVLMDLAVSRLIQDWRTPVLDRVMVLVTMLGDALVLAAVAITTVAWLAWRRRWGVAVAFAVATLLPLGFVPLVKTALARDRPLADLYTGVDLFSFPSGHATNSAVLYGLLAVLIAVPLPRGRRWPVIVGLAGLALAIAFSRVYLQAHWPSDVIAGLLFAAALSAAFMLVIGRTSAAQIAPARLAAIAACALVVVAGAHIAGDYDRAAAAYAPQDLSIDLAADDWRAGGWREVAAGRIGFEGEVDTPFVVQWVGDTAPLREVLAGAGWSTAAPWILEDVWQTLRPSTTIGELPPFPELHLGRSPVATLTKPLDGDARLVFRLWPSRYTVGGEALLVGAIDGERVEHPLGLLTIVEDAPAGPDAVRSLLDALRAQPAVLVFGDTSTP